VTRDFFLYELSDGEFEGLIVQIAKHLLGLGVSPFAPGKDAGRDGKFHGTAERFPSTSSPLVGHIVLQAKHVNAPDRSCSERDFHRQLKAEHPKIKRLVKDGICDHYMVFANRKYTAATDKKLTVDLKNCGLKSAHILGVEFIHSLMESHTDLQKFLPNARDAAPFVFDTDEFVEVIQAFREYTMDEDETAYSSAFDFESLKLKDKNRINGLTEDYFKQVIVARSMPYFDKIKDFLSNPRNREFSNIYADSAAEMKEGILLHRTRFPNFDHVFNFLYGQIQKQRPALRQKRRLVSILLHYMYCHCDIGSKDLGRQVGAEHADA
jgi:hypothetical protein